MIKITRIVPAVAAFAAGFALHAAPARAQTTAMELYYEEPFSTNPDAENPFVEGELNGQNEWQSVPGQAEIVSWGRVGRRTGVAVTSRGGAFGFETLVSSPAFAEFPEPTDDDYILTMLVGFKQRDVTWYVTPKNDSQNTVVTRIKFDKNGTVYVLVPDGAGGGDFVPVPNFTWQANHNYTLNMVMRDDGLMSIAFDNREASHFEGLAFGLGIEAIAVETDNDRAGRTVVIDKIRVRHGDFSR